MPIDWTAARRDLVPTPRAHAEWAGAGYARQVLRCSEEDFADFRSQGFSREDGLYEIHDLWNAALLSGSGGSLPEVQMSLFGMLVSARRDPTAPISYSVRLEVRCPRRERCSGAEWSVPRFEGFDWSPGPAEPGRALFEAEAALAGVRDRIEDPAVERAWKEVLGGYGFHYVPDSVATDRELTRDRRVGDCVALSEVLAQDLRASGIRARARRGFMFGGQDAMAHAVVAFTDADGRDKTLDPSMAALSGRFFNPAYREFCAGSTLNRWAPLAEGEDGVVRHTCGGSTLEQRPRIRVRWGARRNKET